MKFNIELPINPLSLGQVGFGVLREMYNRGLSPNIFPIGNIDLKSFILDEGFMLWLNENISAADSRYSFEDPSIKLWHIMGSHSKLSKRNILWTAHETDTATDTEVNLCKSFDKTLFTSNYSTDIFNSLTNNSVYCPNFFDDLHFFRTNQMYKTSNDVITFGLFGKLEHRKNTLNILVAWARRYAGNENYRLNCSIFNPHINQEVQSKQISDVFGGRIPWNINFMPFKEKNVDYNNVINSIDVDLTGLSGAEGFNLPFFTSLCLGKVGIALDAHAHKDYCSDLNSILVTPEKKKTIYDNVFFKQGAKYNQGNMYHFSLESAFEAMDKAVAVAKQRNVNGELLKSEFTAAKTVDILLNNL